MEQFQHCLTENLAASHGHRMNIKQHIIDKVIVGVVYVCLNPTYYTGVIDVQS